MTTADANNEAILDVPEAHLAAPRRLACRLWAGGKRHSGFLQESEGDGTYTFSASGSAALANPASARHLELELKADGELSAQLALPRFQVFEFELNLPARQVRFHPPGSGEQGPRVYAVDHPFAVSIGGPSLPGRTLVGTVEALSPYELLAVVDDPERLLYFGSLVVLRIARPWQGTFAFYGRTASLERRESETGNTRICFRILDRSSVQVASILAACECPQFSAHTMWTYGLHPQGIETMVRVNQATSEAHMIRVMELRRDANQFFGILRGADDPRLWSDTLDSTANIVLVSLGSKPVATGRLVSNAGDPGKSELEKAVGLPEFIWAGSFVEVSRLAIHPNFRGIGLREPLFRELGRLAFAAGCRFVVFETIPRLVSALEKIGAIRLEVQRQPDSARHVIMYFDLRKLLLGLDRASIAWQRFFAPVLHQIQSVQGPNDLTGWLSSKRGWLTYRLRKILSGPGFSRSSGR